MLIECTAIFLLIFTVAAMYGRAKKRHFAIATIPLLILPLVNILSYLFSENLSHILPPDKFTVYAAINVIAALVSSCLVGVMSSRFSKRSTKLTYVVMSLIFNIMLAAILIYNMFETIYR